MVAEKKDEFDLSQKEFNSRFSLDKITLFTGILFITLSELFLYFLSIKTGSTFGLKEIIFALISGTVITLFLIWTRFIIASNRYLGISINLLGLIAVVYALTRKYKGTYTTTFILIGVLLALAYTIFYLIKVAKK